MKKALALVLALVMALSLVACGGNSNPTPDGGDKTIGGTYDITVWAPEAAVELTKKQINDFNSSNEDGITFNATVEPVSEADAGTNMVTDVEAGGDLFFFAQDQFARLVQAGALSQLGVAAGEAVAAANAAGVVAAATSGDSLYAYPLTADNGYFMYYDKTVIPEEDVDSLEKLIADCEEADKFFAFEAQTSAWYLASWFFATGCKSDWTTDDDGQFISVNDNFNSENGLIAVKGMKKLVDSPKHLSSSSADEFSNGAAIVVTGTWAFEAIKDILGDNMGVTDLPSFEVDGKEYHLGSFNGCKLMGVKPQSDSIRLLALQLLAEYLTDEARQMERFNTLSWGPSNLNAQKSDAVQNNPGLAALLKQNQYSRPQGQIHGAWWDIAKVIGDDVKAATDEAGLKQALQNYYDKISALFTMTEEEKSAWSVIGSICGSNWDKDFPMKEIEPGVWQSEPMELHAGEEFKVRQGASWDVNYGMKDGVTVAGGMDNAKVPADDVYTITIDTNVPELKFVNQDGILPEAAPAEEAEPAAEGEAVANTWAVIGALCGTNWDTDFAMTEKEGVWTSDALELKAGDEFKVRANGAWDLNYGVTEGATVAGGDNLKVEADGTYIVTLDLTDPEAPALSFAEKEPDVWAVIGGICGTAWDTDFAMTEVEPGVWKSDALELKAGEEFKCRANADWAVNMGLDNGVAVQDGPNVKVEADGTYVITLNLNDNTLVAAAE